MRLIIKDDVLLLIPENTSDQLQFKNWSKDLDSHIFSLNLQENGTLEFHHLGKREEASRINIIYSSGDEQIQLISNLGHTPFEMDGRTYASVEGFWQGLKTEEEAVRQKVAAMSGKKAKMYGNQFAQGHTFCYEGETFRTGTWEHWGLMERACLAKFEQCEMARKALLKTGNRLLVHLTRVSSKTIPNPLMADIWMRIRKELGVDV